MNSSIHGVTPEVAKETSILISVIIVSVIAWIGLQLFTERIPPNSMFGLRTRRTLSDIRFWYAANRAAGRYLLFAAATSAALILATLLFAAEYWYGVAECIVLVPLGIAFVLTLAWHQSH